jgi:hypothetical protein
MPGLGDAVSLSCSPSDVADDDDSIISCGCRLLELVEAEATDEEANELVTSLGCPLRRPEIPAVGCAA